MTISWSRRIIGVGRRARMPSVGRRRPRRSARLVLGRAGGSSVGPPPVGRMPSMGVESSSSRTTWPAWTSWIDELVLMIRRWASAGSASALMSSGIT